MDVNANLADYLTMPANPLKAAPPAHFLATHSSSLVVRSGSVKTRL